jgi:hypothetical protein
MTVPVELRKLYDDTVTQAIVDGVPMGDVDDVALAAVLDRHERMVRKTHFAELFGTAEEVTERELTARNATPDDPADLCERIAPGHHAQQVRAKVAEEIEQAADIEGDGSPWDQGMQRAAALVRGGPNA